MDAAGIIWRIRNRQTPSAQELAWFAGGLADQSVSDAQAAAFAMAVCLTGFSDQTRADLTIAMRDSGRQLNWDVDGPILDKHSTGGVGDCVSLILAPVLASLGIYVPMISGRGLGHTGGTLDKLESIPGVNVNLTPDQLQTVIKSCGCVIASASSDLAPADRRLYAIRDVTGTVDSIDLITASILSKKLAAGLQGLVLDVKCGSGAFMKSYNDAQALAHALVQVANLAGCKTTALITDMNEPLAPALGNALEINAAMQVMAGQASGRLSEITKSLVVEILVTHLGWSKDKSQAAYDHAIQSGDALNRFGAMIRLMGGPIGFCENWARYLPEASVIIEVHSQTDGYITGWNGQILGETVVALGGGRRVQSDQINPAVGIDHIMSIGQRISVGQPIARIHATRIEQAKQAANMVMSAVEISDAASQPRPLILDRIAL